MLTTFVVNSMGDDMSGVADGELTLREAIIASNTNAAFGDAPAGMANGDKIRFHLPADAHITLAHGEFEITDDVSIEGNGHITLDAQHVSRIFNVTTDETVRLREISLTNGMADNGGAIYNGFGGKLEIHSSSISNSVANGPSGSGGGIFNAGGGRLSIHGTWITGNTANRAGGGIEDASNVAGVTGLTMYNVHLDGNNAGVDPAVAAPGNGGGLHVTGAGNVWIVGGTANSNVAAKEGGALWNGAGLMVVDGMEIMSNTASGDAADDGGGGIFNNGGDLKLRNVTITDNDADGASGSGGGILSTDGRVWVSRSHVAHNSANRAGGGIEIIDGSLNFYRSALNNNLAGPSGSASPGNGGGLHVTRMDTHVRIERSEVMSNTAALEGGGLWNQGGDSSLAVVRSTVAENSAMGDKADDGGGGIFNNGGRVSVWNSHIMDNVAHGASGSGGGILSLDGDVEVTKSKIHGNSASRAGGGVEIVDGELQVIRSSLNGNVAGPEGSAAPGNGGAVHVTGDDATVAIRRSDVKDNVAAREGGGLWNQMGSYMIVDRSVVKDNVAMGDAADDGGGGIFNNGGDVVVNRSRISKNHANGASGSGGGLFSTDGKVEIVSSTLDRNVANRAGGGIEIVDGELELSRVVLVHNIAGPAGSASPGNGGALHVTGRDTRVEVWRSYVGGNLAGSEGGGLWNQAGSTMIVKRSQFTGNSALGVSSDNGGGALFNNGGVLRLETSIVQRNSAASEGGGGGGIFTTDGGITEVKRSRVSLNSPNNFAGPGDISLG